MCMYRLHVSVALLNWYCGAARKVVSVAITKLHSESTNNDELPDADYRLLVDCLCTRAQCLLLLGCMQVSAF